MLLHSIIAEKKQRWLQLKPRPDYTGMTLMQRIRAKCADAKREVSRRQLKYKSSIRYEAETEVGKSRVAVGGWTALGLRGGAG